MTEVIWYYVSVNLDSLYSLYTKEKNKGQTFSYINI